MSAPASNLDWTVGNPNFGTVTVEPTGGKKETGWTPSEKPPAETMNWLFYNIDQWVKYLNESVDTLTQSIATIESSLTAMVPVHEVPTTPDRTVFTFTESPISSDAVWFFVDGVALKKSEFVLAGPVLTLAAPLPPGQLFDSIYIKEIGVSVPGGGATPSAYTPYGSIGSPVIVNGLVGVPVLASQRQMIFVVSNGGAVSVTANPQVAPGPLIGAECILIGTSDTNYLSLSDGNGLALNGAVDLKNNKTITLVWTGSVWLENGRR